MMTHDRTSASGFTIVELIFALVVLSVGILAVAQVLSSGSASQVRSSLVTSAAQYASESLEDLRNLRSTNAALTAGRHPASGYDTLGTNKALRRSYTVSSMAAPLNSLVKVTVQVNWAASRPDSVVTSSYLMP